MRGLMKNLIFTLCALFTFSSFAYDGLTIGNSFQVDPDGKVFRGREPKKLVTDLKKIGITDVIIFKMDTRGEVVSEINELKNLGIRSHHIPFRWKEYPTMTEPCEQFVHALTLIQKIKAQGGKVFFHCTAGEDRTGALAGLYRMLEENLTTQEAFTQEMCPRGYSDGNPAKPFMVSSAIQKELTPLFLTLSAKIEKREWRLGKLSLKSCQNLQIKPTKLQCRP